MYSEKDIQQQFKTNKMLKPDFWDKSGKLNPKIRKALLRIAQLFIKSLEKDVNIKDIVFTGSLANYNYSDYSDVDLHIIIDYTDLGADSKMVEEYLALKKNKWNQDHDIRMFGHEVEIYVEDQNAVHTSTGVYSVLNNSWKIKPKAGQPSFNPKDVAKKANYFKNLYISLSKKFKSGDLSDIPNAIIDIKDDIKKMRRSGLKSGGEFSTENLAFKVLRRSGILDRFSDLYNKVLDSEMSI